MKIIKRNGAEVVFDIDKIRMAVTKANNAVEESVRMTPLQIERIAQSVEIQLKIFTPVGIAMSIVVRLNTESAIGPRPTANMWCGSHTHVARSARRLGIVSAASVERLCRWVRSGPISPRAGVPRIVWQLAHASSRKTRSPRRSAR